MANTLVMGTDKLMSGRGEQREKMNESRAAVHDDVNHWRVSEILVTEGLPNALYYAFTYAYGTLLRVLERTSLLRSLSVWREYQQLSCIDCRRKVSQLSQPFGHNYGSRISIHLNFLPLF
jgi:hypothetical protein